MKMSTFLSASFFPPQFYPVASYKSLTAPSELYLKSFVWNFAVPVLRVAGSFPRLS
jgi:hypothetical protein